MEPLETRIEAAVSSLTAWCTHAETTYRLGNLELLTVLANVVAIQLAQEAVSERAAIEQLKDAMSNDAEEHSADEGSVVDAVDTGTPTCCRKHSMMGTRRGKCAGGPPLPGGTMIPGPERGQLDVSEGGDDEDV